MTMIILGLPLERFSLAAATTFSCRGESVSLSGDVCVCGWDLEELRCGLPKMMESMGPPLAKPFVVKLFAGFSVSS